MTTSDTNNVSLFIMACFLAWFTVLGAACTSTGTPAEQGQTGEKESVENRPTLVYFTLGA